jgi:hypothetical protein
MSDTVTEWPGQLDSMRREANRGLMVAFINADLLNRASLDVRHSIVLLDADGMFEYALPELPDDDTLARLFEQTRVRFWQRGC